MGTPQKAELAAAAGADHTILYRDVDFAEAVTELAGERPLDVVYDGVGKSVFAANPADQRSDDKDFLIMRRPARKTTYREICPPSKWMLRRLMINLLPL